MSNLERIRTTQARERVGQRVRMAGGQRVHSYPQLLNQIERWGLDAADFTGYLEAFRYGMPPHGGFGMGAERLLQMLVGAGNLRETTLFPRDMKRLSP